MDPDKAHTEYFSKNPTGNHDKMSPMTQVVIDYIKEEIREIKEKLEPISEMRHTQKDILDQVKKTNGRVSELEKYRTKTETGVGRLLKNEEARYNFIRGAIWKIVAVGSLGALLTQNARKVIDIFL